MKILPVLFCFLVLFVSAANSPAQTHSLSAKSRIGSVTVYPEQAQVTRAATISLKAGTNLVRFDGLPQFLAEESLRAEGQGAGRARIAGITTRTVYLERLQEKRIHLLEEEILTLNRQVESLDAKRKALAAQKAFLESIRVGWGERISKDLTLGKPSVAEMGEAAKFVGDGVGRIEEQILDAEAAKRPLLNRIAALKKELEQSRGEREKEVRSVEVAIEAERAMEFTLSLSYLVGQAHWEPGYDVRLAPDGASAELTYRAQVWQQTGEDWPGVKLALSTATPEAGGAPPELRPWQVFFYEPPRPMPRYGAKASRVMDRAANMEMMAPMAAAPAPGGAAPMEIALPATAEVQEGQTSVLFNVAQPADIPADGNKVASVIAFERVPVTAEFVTVPKLSPRVYLKTEVTNETPYPLLAGQVNIFNDTVFTGKSHLKKVAAGEKFDLFFGADDRIKVKRDLARVRKQAGLLGSNRISYRISVELHNFRKQAATVSLLDQMPLAGNEEIKVHLDEAQPKPDETRPDGTLSWKVALAPGEKKKVSYDIVIEYPKGRELTGIE